MIKINTPICDFVRNYAESKITRAHMPGHKGNAPFSGSAFKDAYLYDITEIKGADALFEADGIIGESEKKASELFHTAETIYSTSGSTACIQSMLLTAVGYGGKIIAGRNAHISFTNACALLDIDVKWVYTAFTDSYVCGNVSAKRIDEALSEYHADAVYITSPDYYGNIADIKAVSEVCKKHSAYLLVDNAHGAYTAFLKESIHPIILGADMCCDSAHKTLPVLTGGAYLHTGNKILTGKAKKNMSLFCSTSPSYLILQSLDLCNRYLAEEFPAKLDETVKRVNELKDALSPAYNILPTEPLKLTIHTPNTGLDGRELADILREKLIEPEYADSLHLVLMLSPFNSEKDFEKIKSALQNVIMPRIIPFDPKNRKLPVLEKAMPIREAVFSKSEEISVGNSAGRICAKAVYICPPCISAVIPGEIISREITEILHSLGIKKITVIKEQK